MPASSVAGFIKVHRRVLDHPALRDPNTLGFWIMLIAKAKWDDRNFRNLQRGQLLFSALEFAREHDVSEKWVRHRLELFIAEGMIETRRAQRGVIITITNYDHWQNPEDDHGRKVGANRNPPKRPSRGEQETAKNGGTLDLFGGNSKTGANRGANRGANVSKETKNYKNKITPTATAKPGKAAANGFGEPPSSPDAILYRVAKEHFGTKVAPIITRLKRLGTIHEVHELVKLAITKHEPIAYLAATIHQWRKANEQRDRQGRTIEQRPDGSFENVAAGQGNRRPVPSGIDAFVEGAAGTRDPDQ